MKYEELVGVYSRLEGTSKRLEKTRIIAEFLQEKKELKEVLLLLQGRVFPKWDETNLGIASKLVVKAITKSSGISQMEVEKIWKETGDLGKTAQNTIKGKKQSTLFSHDLTVKKVFDNLRKLSTLEGLGSVDRKIQLISELLTSSKPEEARYIVRTLLEDLRVGVGEGSLRDAIVWSYFSDKIGIDFETGEISNREEYKKYAEAVQEAYDIMNDFSAVAEIARDKGIGGLLEQELLVGKPVKVMLALKVNDAEDGLERVGKPAEVEYKLDGFRIQAHKNGDKIKLYTRRLEEVTDQFPDIVKAIRENVSCKDCIIDSEAVGYSPKTLKYLPFQNISQRIKRKYNIEEISEKFPVELNVFDILYYNGKSLLKEDFSKRREIIEKIVKNEEKKIVVVKKIVTEDVREIREFFNESLSKGNEGLMLKNLTSPYKPGARVGYMVKLKETLENLDLVIIGAEWGEGKRSSWLSSYILAIRDEDGNLLEIGRVSTGLKEKKEEGLSFEEMTEMLKPLVTSAKGKEVKVKPEIVIEVAYEEIQKSTNYSSGYALRFPRVIGLREERNTDSITDIDYLEELYYGQNK